MAENNGSSALLGFLLGVAVGGTLALLLAPQSGKQTRDMLKKSLDETEAKAREELEKGLEFGREMAGKAKDQASQAREKVDHLVHQGKDAVEHSLAELEQRKNQIAAAIEAGRKAMADAKKEV